MYLYPKVVSLLANGESTKDTTSDPPTNILNIPLDQIFAMPARSQFLLLPYPDFSSPIIPNFLSTIRSQVNECISVLFDHKYRYKRIFPMQMDFFF